MTTMMTKRMMRMMKMMGMMRMMRMRVKMKMSRAVVGLQNLLSPMR